MNVIDGKENQLLSYCFKWWGNSSWDGAPKEILNTQLLTNKVSRKAGICQKGVTVCFQKDKLSLRWGIVMMSRAAAPGWPSPAPACRCPQCLEAELQGGAAAAVGAGRALINLWNVPLGRWPGSSLASSPVNERLGLGFLQKANARREAGISCKEPILQSLLVHFWHEDENSSFKKSFNAPCRDAVPFSSCPRSLTMTREAFRFQPSPKNKGTALGRWLRC